MGLIRHTGTNRLNIAFETSGNADHPAVVLLHGFPYDPRAFDEVVAMLTARGLRTIVPYLRGYGETTFLSLDAMRSGEQAALGADLRDLMDALGLRKALLAGFDWGGRAANVVAALWPARVAGLLSCGGYVIQDIAASARPASPQQEARLWYQYYFHLERGKAGLAENRRDLCRLLWEMWSPSWHDAAEAFDKTMPSLDNADFVDIVIHSYRHRTGHAAGDPLYADIERRLAVRPMIGVPTLVLHGADDGVLPAAASDGHARLFTGFYERRVLAGVGHNPPQEAPSIFADAVLDLHARADWT